jgi:nucleotide-binding universal stress UspA family protein
MSTWSLLAVVAVDGMNDMPRQLSDKLGISKGYFVTVIRLDDSNGMERGKAMEQLLASQYQREGWKGEVIEANQGSIGRSLCDFVETVNADLLIIGHSTKRADHLFGSTAQSCIRHCKCSVVIAK